MTQSSRLWLYRTKPQEDELFSSWLVRLAHGLAVKLQSFVVQFLGEAPGFWTSDVDRNPDRRALEVLSVGAAIPLTRLSAMGLLAYEGYLWSSYHRKGALHWVMPIGRDGRRRRDHGQQFCRLCLVEDARPYFRRRWRLAFNVVCERHGIMLDDACRLCGAPVEFHVGDFGKQLLDFDCPIVRCGSCGTDLRFTAAGDDRTAPVPLARFQSTLSMALRDGWSPSLPGGSFSFLAFDGLRCIVRLLVSRSRGGRLRELMLAREGDLPLNPPTLRPRAQFEELRIGDRSRILQWCADITRSWPYNFILLCREARVSSAYILHEKGAQPYWLESVVEEYLRDQDYRPTEAEWVAATEWLNKAAVPISTNLLRRWLGLSHSGTKNLLGESSVEGRWNPRGPYR